MLYIIILSVLLNLILVIKLYKKNKLMDSKQKIYLHNKCVMSMIEYQYRNYKEGQNIYTTIRNIKNILIDNSEDVNTNE